LGGTGTSTINNAQGVKPVIKRDGDVIMKQIIIALVTIVSVASLATVGVVAHFSDTEESRDNYLETGSIDLQLGDEAPVVKRSSGAIENPSAIAEGFGEDPLGDSVTESWLLPTADVGDTVSSRVWVRNVGSLSGDHLDIYCTINNIDPEGDTIIPKDEMLVINYLTYYDKFKSFSIPIVYTIDNVQTCTAPYMANMDSDTRITLHDLELHGIPGLPVPNGDSIQLEMSVTFDVPLNVDPDQYQGDETIMTLIFHLQ